MGNTSVEEGINVLKRLSPKNQTYFMTLLRLAEAAEAGARNEATEQPRKPPTKLEEEKAAKANGTKERPKTAYPSEKAAV